MAAPNTCLAIFVAGLSVGCAGNDVPEGQLRDRGPLAAHDRYVLDLGPIDLTSQNQQVYSLDSLPIVEFTVGLTVTAMQPSDGPIYETKPVASVIKLEMTNERGELVFSAARPLSEWTWSGNPVTPSESFVYLRGRSEERAVRPGVTISVPRDVLADAGWGSYFTPRRIAHYKLRVEVVDPLPMATYRAKLQARGGGWK
jgi:hypothetical protein